ncbi:MAG: glycosyltransferase [Acidobacteriaceae bacterium]
MRNAQAEILRGSSLVLMLTSKERRDIAADIGEVPDGTIAFLRNGFEKSPAAGSAALSTLRDIDVCVVGRIEARKNQIAILKALDKLGISGVFVGLENANHKRYCAKFKERIAESKSDYIGGAPHGDIVQIMRRSKAHVSASWFEVSSLVDIEAYFCGCQVVSSLCGGTREILGERALYIDPGSEESIERAIAAALQQSRTCERKSIDDEGAVESWEFIGRELNSLYHKILDSQMRQQEQ